MNNDRNNEDRTWHLEEEDIIPYLEGKLDEALLPGVEFHLNGCGDCRAHLAALRSVMAEMDEWAVSEPPASPSSFDAAVRLKIAAEGSEETGWLARWLQPAWGLALGVFVLGAAGLWMLPRGTVTSDLNLNEVAIIEADVDALFQASLDWEGDGGMTGDDLWMADYEWIQEFDALFEDGENGHRQL